MIEVTSVLKDKKVDSLNVQFNIDIGSYVAVANDVIKNNPFQRNKVNKSGSIYQLLKQDVKDGCIIPPIVLASVSESAVKNGEFDSEYLKELLAKHADLRILDGLQRTYSLIEVYEENREHFDNLEEKYIIRVEIYLAIRDVGILYRMLTLNTGQTPMTLRHQLEILFSKYLGSPIEDVNIIREIDGSPIRSVNDFKFSDLIDGYDSYLERNELPIDRFDILQNVKTIETISKSEGKSVGFVEFVKSYSRFIRRVEECTPCWEYPSDEEVDEAYRTNANPFGNRVFRIFNKSQPLTGYGAAISGLKEVGAINDLSEIEQDIEKLQFSSEDLLLVNKYLDDVREKSKKIGNGQRIFFKLWFKNLFDREGATYLDVKESLLKAKNRAMAEV